MKRRRKFVNEISTDGLRRVGFLLELAKRTELATPTGVLLRAAGLGTEPHTGRGALKIAEVLGLIHASRGERKTLLWQPGPAKGWQERDPKLPDLLPFRRLRDLLQYYRGSLIGTPDLIRDIGAPNRREILGALKALHVLGLVEIGKLDPQTIAWRWVAGRGQSRTYQRGYFRWEEAPVSFDDGPRNEQGRVRWQWLDETVHREWLLQEQADGFAAVADNDGTRRYRPPTADGQMVLNLINEGLRAMPVLQRAVLKSTLLRGLSERETAGLLRISASTVRRLSERGLDALRKTLTEEGFAPSALTIEPGDSSEVAHAA